MSYVKVLEQGVFTHPMLIPQLTCILTSSFLQLNDSPEMQLLFHPFDEAAERHESLRSSVNHGADGVTASEGLFVINSFLVLPALDRVCEFPTQK